jgi:hypothetical protein
VGRSVCDAEKVTVELGERGPLVAAAGAGDATDVGGALHGAESGEGGKVFLGGQAAVFVEDDGAVEGDVVADVESRLVLADLGAELGESVGQGYAMAPSSGRGDAVDAGGFGGNGEAVGVDDVMDCRQFLAAGAVERLAD